MFSVKKSKFTNRLKRALPKFRGDRSEVRGVNGRSKFAVAAVRPPSVEKYLEAPLRTALHSAPAKASLATSGSLSQKLVIG